MQVERSEILPMKKIHKNVLGKNQKLDQDKERMHNERIAQAIADACFLAH